MFLFLAYAANYDALQSSGFIQGGT